MSRFQQFWWYIGVCMTTVALLFSVFTRNWVLAVLCAFSTAMLRKRSSFLKFIPSAVSKMNGLLQGEVGNEKDNK